MRVNIRRPLSMPNDMRSAAVSGVSLLLQIIFANFYSGSLGSGIVLFAGKEIID